MTITNLATTAAVAVGATFTSGTSAITSSFYSTISSTAPATSAATTRLPQQQSTRG